MKRILFCFLSVVLMWKLLVLMSGCAQIISPTGGTRDTIPPVLEEARPSLNATNFSGNRITLNFDEYIVIDQLRENLLVSPTPKLDPNIDFKLKTVTIRLRDTLEANTTYTIDLGNAIRDNNESNVLKQFSYVFSTGPVIDSLSLSGKVRIAETGKPDSTLQAYLYKNLDDSAVFKQKPKYIAKLDSTGKFSFRNLAPGKYNLFALKDGDGQKTFNSKTEMFAFVDSVVNVNATTPLTNLSLYAFQEEKETARAVKTLTTPEKKLKYSVKVPGTKQDILNDLVIEYNKPLTKFNPQQILLTDTLFNTRNPVVTLDSTTRKIVVKTTWLPDAFYELIVSKDAASDSTGLVLPKSDTIRFKTMSETDYGSIKINFIGFTKEKNPVLQFVKNEVVTHSYPLTSASWNAPLFEPGEYDLRILFDENNNGYWDPGNYTGKKQPEKVFNFQQKLSIRANWENERDIEMPGKF